MSNGTLLVTRVRPSDRGEYKCQAVNLMGTSVTSVLVSYLGDPGLSFTYVLYCKGNTTNYFLQIPFSDVYHLLLLYHIS